MTKEIGTSVTTSAVFGDKKTFVSSPDPSTKDSVFVNSDESDVMVRQRLLLNNRPARVSSNNTVVRKAKANYTIPVEDADTGEIRYATIRIEISVDPRDEGTVLAELRSAGQSILGAETDTNLENFWLYGDNS